MPGPSMFTRLGLAVKTLVGNYPAEASPVVNDLLSGVQLGWGSAPPKRGTFELLKAYGEMPWLRAVAGRVSTLVGSTQWQLYQAAGPAGKAILRKDLQDAPYAVRQKLFRTLKAKGQLQPIPSHPMRDFLIGGNSMHIGQTLRKMLQLDIDLVGEGYWLKERNALGVPIRAWPIPPFWILNLPTPVSRVYRVGFRGFHEDIPDTEILSFIDPDLVNPYGRGVGLGTALADELDTDEAAAKVARSFFYNRGAPDLIIAGKSLQRDQTERMEDSWMRKARSGGVLQAVKAFFLNQDVQVTKISNTIAEMQLPELRKFERDTIVQTFGVPPEDLGIIENSNRSTIDASGYKLANNVIVPRLEFLRETFQQRLVPEYDDRIIVDYESPVAEDKEFALKVMQARPESFTVDEIRDLAGREPLPNNTGQVYIGTLGQEAVSDPSKIGAMPEDTGGKAAA